MPRRPTVPVALTLLAACGGFGTSAPASPPTREEPRGSEGPTPSDGSSRRFSALAAGGTHTCVLDDAGTVACWGGNGSGQLGDGTTVSRGTAQPVPGIRGAVEVAAGRAHTCVRTRRGSVFCFGANDRGQTGTGAKRRRVPVPTRVPGLGPVAALAAGAHHTCARTETGTVYCWGANDAGQIRPHGPLTVPVPTEVAPLRRARILALGERHTCAVVGDRVRCMGADDDGRLGAPNGPLVDVPRLSGVTGLAAGKAHTCAVAGADLWCWGAARALGRRGGSTGPVRIPTGGTRGPVAALAAGDAHTCLATAGGALLCFGKGEDGRLGRDAGRAAAPVPVAGVGRVRAVAAGAAHTCVLSSDGNVRCFGRNDDGALGDGSTGAADRTTPAPTVDLEGAVALDAGEDFACALMNDRTVRCWGRGDHGQLGRGGRTDGTSPRPVPGLAGVVAVSTGARHACAVRKEGTVHCFGDDGSGQSSGRPSPSPRMRPVQVRGIARAVAVAAGRDHTCILRKDGTVACFGADDDGQLGDGRPGGPPGPVTVAGLSRAVEIAAGDRHTCARLSSGSVRCWGRNRYGQLGNAARAQDLKLPHPAPVAVRGIDDARALTAGDEFSCVLRGTGAVACFGRNDRGQLGSGTTMHWLTRVPVKGLSGVQAVDAGRTSACAVRSSGEVVCWGEGARGKLGNGDMDARPLATPVAGLSDAVAVAVGGSFACALRRAEAPLCWGADDHGQIGDGGVAWSARPLPVVGLTAP